MIFSRQSSSDLDEISFANQVQRKQSDGVTRSGPTETRASSISYSKVKVLPPLSIVERFVDLKSVSNPDLLSSTLFRIPITFSN